MRILASVLVIAACSGPAKTPKSPGNAAPIADLPVTAFVADKPTYLLAAPKVRDAQTAIRDAIDSVGLTAGVDATMVSRALEGLIAVDPLNADPAAAIGVDLDGGLAIFSENLDPTVVVHLSAPEAIAQFFDRLRQRGLVAQSVMVDGVEVFSAKLAPGIGIGWAVDKDWLFVHLAAADGKGTEWFEHSHHPAGAAWASDWSWSSARHKGPASLLGFVQLRELVGRFASHAQALAACAKLVEPVARIGVSLDADLHHVSGRLAVDLGPSARSVAQAAIAPPPGWAQTAQNAAIALQLNLDADAVVAWAEPCLAGFGGDLGSLKKLGVRTARAMLLSFDPDEASGTGAIALDLDRTDFVAHQLDKIPMRSHFESDRTFGGHKGHHLKIPFTVELDYVLEDKVAAAAMGDGVLAQIFAPAAAPAQAPLAELDVTPKKLPAKAWEWLIDRAGVPGAHAVAEHLQRFRDAHVTLGIDGDALVLDASGNLE